MNYLIRYWTTTDKTSDEIYQTGLSEVKRIRMEMETVKTSNWFPGRLASFFFLYERRSAIHAL